MNGSADEDGADYEVGSRRPPLHSRFKPGQSGNPSGRAKGSQNLRTLFNKILNEQIPLIDGNQSKTITKAEAILRQLIIGALKGDSRSLLTLLRLAEATGHFEEKPEPPTRIERVIVRWESGDPPLVPASRGFSREDA
jgi:hypothetical protein